MNSLSNLLYERALIEAGLFRAAEDVVRFDGTERLSLETLRKYVYKRKEINREIEEHFPIGETIRYES
jgi:hypothetical protein